MHMLASTLTTAQSWGQLSIHWIDRTVSSTEGQHKATRLQIAILNLSSEIFSGLPEECRPMLEALQGYNSFCNTFEIVTLLNRSIETKELTVFNAFRLLNCASNLISTMRKIGILAAYPQTSSETGNLQVSIWQAVWNNLTKNPRRTLMMSGAIWGISSYLYHRYQTRKEEGKNPFLPDWELGLSVIKVSGRMLPFLLRDYLPPLSGAFIELGVSLFSYSRFLKESESKI